MPDLVEWASPMTGGMLSWFLEATVVASVLAALAGLGTRLGRTRLGPATRHVLWLIVLIKLMAPPLIPWPGSIRSSLAQLREETARSVGRSFGTLAKGRDELSRPAPTEARTSVAEAVPSEDDDEARAVLPLSTREPDPTKAVDRAIPPTAGSFPLWAGVATVGVWLAGSVVLILRQARLIFRFRRLLGDATPAPGWLVEEASRLGERMGVRPPEVRVVSGLSTPLLWCLGCPVLLVPGSLLKSLESTRWRAILAHELAHLRRKDHWVRRLELAAGVVWWWNPLYWLTLRNLDHEAELACDAWVLWASPKDRITYAESLIRICSALSPTSTATASPSLGIAGSGPSFERRLTMILNERVDNRASLSSLLAALAMAALALPSWTVAEAADPVPKVVEIPVVSVLAVPEIIEVRVTADGDDDDESPKEKREIDAKKEAERAALEKKMEALGQEMEKKFGPGSDFAKKMETLGQEMEKKFGPDSDFAKKMEVLGEEMAKKFGPDSDFVKEIAKSFGPDSDFAGEMKKLGLDLSVFVDVQSDDDDTAKTDRDDARKAKEKAEAKAKVEVEVKKSIDPGKLKAKLKAEDQAKKAKQMVEDQVKGAKEEAKKAREKAETARAAAKVDRDEARKVKEKGDTARVTKKPEVDAKRRASRIDALQSRIDEMQKQLKQLKAESKDNEDEDEEG